MGTPRGAWGRIFGGGLLVAMTMAASLRPAPAGETGAGPRSLLRNVHVFDGLHEKRIKNAGVLVEGNLIKQLPQQAIEAEGATLIDGGGRTLMPGLTDAHSHIVVSDSFEALVCDHPQTCVGALGAANAKAMLQRAFTTIRDAGDPSMGINMAIDQGVLEGPRILPSGAFLSQSASHGDFDPRMGYLSRHFAGVPDKAARTRTCCSWTAALCRTSGCSAIRRGTCEAS